MKKISSFLVVLLLMLASFTAGVEYQRGDVSQDGQVDIEDVTCLINYLLNGTWGDEPVTPPEEHEWVDLGLPSGTLWAKCNIGADSPEEFGWHFAWGETERKAVYDWSTYKWCEGTGETMTKYCTNSAYGYNGFTDGKTELDPEDDAAYVNWGPSWRMPTFDQQLELIENCSWTWTTINGMNGQLGIGPNGKTIFLPAAGSRWDGSYNNAGSCGSYWARKLGPSVSAIAYCLMFTSESVYWHCDVCRYGGFTVRAVRVSQN